MAISYNGIKNLLENNLVELSFSRRNIKQGWPNNRRMLCTNSVKLLGSFAGKIALNFKVPTSFPAYDPKENDLFITWDIFMQDFRSIPLEAVFIINAIPVKTDKDIENFWKYFDKALKPMSSQQKTNFMKK
jgi:hypothetical protein